MKNITKASRALLWTVTFLLVVNQAFSQHIHKNIDAVQADSLIQVNASNPNFVILDVRRLSEWTNKHLEGSINRDYYQSDFRQQLDRLPKHKTFLIHCQSGGRSAKAFTIMQELGFAEVYNMTGGISSWQNKSFPVTKDAAPLLMLVSQQGSKGLSADTMHITLTNRANDTLVFNAFNIEDQHHITHNFVPEITLQGAEDYTFSIYHSPAYEYEDSTQVTLESNGGNLAFKVKVGEQIASSTEYEWSESFAIYPNPASGILRITGLDTNEEVEISIYNMQGRCVLHKYDHPAHKNLSVMNLKEGLHVIMIRKGDSILSKKMLIKR